MSSHEPTILRKGYERAGYRRAPYERADGTHVKAAYIAPTHVKAARIPARGMSAVTGHKGKKLINMQDYVHLSNYGYGLHHDSESRHRSLTKSVEKVGYAHTLRRVNAISTLLKNTEPALSKKAKADVHYLQRKHKS